MLPDAPIETLVEIASLRQENARLRRAKELRESFGINFYRPHAKQDKFHSSSATGRYGRTGNRFGKSEMGIIETISHLLGQRLFYKEEFDVVDGEGKVVRHHEGGEDHPLVRQGIAQRPIKGLLIVVDWDMAKKIFTGREGSYETWGKFFKFCPKNSVGKIGLSRGGHIETISVKRPDGGESTLFIDTIESYKHNKLGAESMDWDFIHVDEPCPEKMFKAHARGLMDRNGKYWFTCTPLDEMWINDLFVPPKQHVVKEAAEGLTFGTKYIITGSIYDNPHRTPAGVEEFKSTLTSEEQQCRLFGLPLALAGLIYKEFEYDVHVLAEVPKGWEDYHRPPKNYTIRQWWDFHTRLPQAVLFFATDPKNCIYVYDELFTDNLVGPVAQSIVDKSEGYFVADREIDRFALIPHPVYETTIVDELLPYGLFFEPATKDKRLGINKVRQKLLERDHNGKPTIFFSPNLAETLFEFTHYVYDIAKQEPKDENDHMMENLYRAILNGLSYIEPPDDSDYSPRAYVIRDTGDLNTLKIASYN